MERLTTDSPKNMIEMFLNCGIIKDGEAYYRDFNQEISTREFIRKIISMYAQNEISNDDTLSDDNFDDIMTDNLQYGERELIGVIALLYQALISVSELREKLKQYEDLEEQGKLLKLPYKAGDQATEGKQRLMERLTKRINGYAHGAEGKNKDKLTGNYCRGCFEATVCIEKLAEYEDLEEQGKLLKLPCKVGDLDKINIEVK